MLQSPQKKVDSILREIEKGMAHEGDTSSLIQILNEQPSILSDIILSLAYLMAKDDSRYFLSACLVLNRIADENPDKVSESLENIMEILSVRKKGLNESEWMLVLELFTKIHEGHPENMRTAVPSLLEALGNANRSVRENAYFLLVNIAAKNPDFFEYSSGELIKNLNGLNLDERLFACKIIGLIAAKNPRIVEKTYDVLEDFSLNHPDSNLRSEAGFAVNLLKTKTSTSKQPESKVPLIKQDDKGSELKRIINEIAPKKSKTMSTVEAPVMGEIMLPGKEITSGEENGIKNRTPIENALQMLISGGVIKSATLVGRSGRIIAQSGHKIDNSLLIKLTSILSFDSKDQSRNRISIERADKKIVAVGVGNRAVLVAVTGADTSMGMLFIILNKFVEKLNGILMDGGFSETL